MIALKTDRGNKYSQREYENAKSAGRRERSEDFSSNNEMSILQETLVSVVSPRQLKRNENSQGTAGAGMVGSCGGDLIWATASKKQFE